MADSVPQVEYIEQDAVMTASDYVTQADVPWGLARISHRGTGATSYVYDESAGEGTCSYIIDTGIYVDHTVGLFFRRSCTHPFQPLCPPYRQ